MKAFVHRRYGSPDELALEDVDVPEPADDAVLVRVRAASVNAYDWHMVRGQPYIARIGEGFRRPKSAGVGVDAAGVVEAVGKAVMSVRPGDAVFGARNGAFAEFVSGRNFVPMPAGLTFEQAAAVPVAGTTALQALRDKGRLVAGQRVLITGAGGGVGTFAVQIAKASGGTVAAVTSPRKADLVASLGADEVIDGTSEDFTRTGRRFDLLIDIGGHRRLAELSRALTPDGTLVMVGPGGGQWLGPVMHVVAGRVRSRLGRRRFVPFLAKVNRDDLLALKALVEAGTVRPVIDRTFPFEAGREAIRHVESGDPAGKVVISVSRA